MPVTYLELENFKSYAGKHVIGPFKDFTSIVGPNGSGKSNIMDAISFVLGVQSKDLRSQQLKDLIYRPPGDKVTRRRASATLHYETVDAPELVLHRSIAPSGHGEYRINDKVVSFKEYDQQLADIGVLTQIRNCLVFQGDVEALARKSPTELVELLELISGSAQYKEEYVHCLAAKEQADQDVLHCVRKQKTLRSERRILKDQREEAQRFEQLLGTKAALETEFYLWTLYHIDQDRIDRQAAAEDLQAELQEALNAEQEASNMLQQLKKEASAARRHTTQADKKRIQLAAKVDQLQPSLIETNEEIENLEKKITQDKRQLEKKQQETLSHRDKVKAITDEIQQYQEVLKETEKEYQEIKQSAASIQLTPQQEEEYERVRELATTASVEPRRILLGATRKLESARAHLHKITSEYDQAKDMRAEISKDVADFSERRDKLTKVSLRSLLRFSLCRKTQFCLIVYSPSRKRLKSYWAPKRS